MGKKYLFIMLSLIVVLLLTGHAFAAEVTVNWSESAKTETSWAQGYRVHLGTSTGVYDTLEGFPLDVGNTLTTTFTLEDEGTYYLAITGYNIVGESSYSKEISFVIEPPVPIEEPDPPDTSTGFSGTIRYENGRIVEISPASGE